jgi:glycosyltransferase involved in cell wall biosynthesis
MTRRLFVHAYNVHQGGGRSLLDALLKAIKGEVVLCLDVRMPLLTFNSNTMEVRRVSPSIFQRFVAEKWLVKSVGENDTVLCFGNLPPLFKLKGRTFVYIHNRYLIDYIGLDGFSFKIRLRLMLERIWLNKRLMNVDEFVVQTPTMKRLLEAKTHGKKPIRVLPFVSDSSVYIRNAPFTRVKDTDYDFVYVASGEPHKNHQKLLEAWCFLAKDGLFPSLCLTLDDVRFADLCCLIQKMRKLYGLKVINLGEISHREVLVLYKTCGAAIFPSKFESFGLPLIEANQAGLPVLASELDYVRDVLDPEQVFDPDSPVSIARAVKRYVGFNEKPLALLNADLFLSCLFNKDIQ